jgi:hypothetical protein
MPEFTNAYYDYLTCGITAPVAGGTVVVSGSASYYMNHFFGAADRVEILIGSAPLCAAGCSTLTALHGYYSAGVPSTNVLEENSGYLSGIYYNVPAGYNPYYMTSTYWGTVNAGDQWDWGDMTITWYPPAP